MAASSSSPISTPAFAASMNDFAALAIAVRRFVAASSLRMASSPMIFMTSGGGGGCGTLVASLMSVAPMASSMRWMSHSWLTNGLPANIS